MIDNTPLTFGKYRGKTPEQVAEVDESYIVWMYDNVMPKPCSKELRDACEADIREMEYENCFGVEYWNE
jgi:uncharacterized protein (DUF3820 family)